MTETLREKVERALWDNCCQSPRVQADAAIAIVLEEAAKYIERCVDQHKRQAVDLSDIGEEQEADEHTIIYSSLVKLPVAIRSLK